MRHLSFLEDSEKDVTLSLRERGILAVYVISFFMEEFVKEYSQAIESRTMIHDAYHQMYWLRFSLEDKVPELFKEEAEDLTMAEVETKLINAVMDIFNPIVLINGMPVMITGIPPFTYLDLIYERHFYRGM